jgi:kinesin family protein 3/17
MDMHESPDKGLFIKDLTINVVRSTEEMDRFMTIGTNNRSVGAT